jgi:hypothetical protein
VDESTGIPIERDEDLEGLKACTQKFCNAPFYRCEAYCAGDGKERAEGGFGYDPMADARGGGCTSWGKPCDQLEPPQVCCKVPDCIYDYFPVFYCDEKKTCKQGGKCDEVKEPEYLPIGHKSDPLELPLGSFGGCDKVGDFGEKVD